MEEKGKKVPVLRTNNSLIEDEFDSIRSRFDEEMRKIDQEMARFKSHMNVSLGSELLANCGKMATAADSVTASSSSTRTTKTRTTKTTSLTDKTINKRIGEDRPQRPAASERTTKSVVESDGKTTSGQIDHQRHHPEQADRAKGGLVEAGSEREAGGGSGGDQAQCIDSPLIVNDSRVAGGKMLKLRFDVSSYEPDQIVVATIDNRLQVYAKRNEVSANKSTFSEYNREFLLPAGTNPDTIKSALSADGVLTIEAPLAAKT